jgi:hypothetical protein
VRTTPPSWTAALLLFALGLALFAALRPDSAPVEARSEAPTEKPSLPVTAAPVPLGCPQHPALRVVSPPTPAADALLRFGGGPHATADSAACRAGIALTLTGVPSEDAVLEALSAAARGELGGAQLGLLAAEGAAPWLQRANLALGSIARDPEGRPPVVVLALLAESAADEVLLGPGHWRADPTTLRGVAIAARSEAPAWRAVRRHLEARGVPVVEAGAAWRADAVHRIDAPTDEEAAQMLVDGRCERQRDAARGVEVSVCVEGVAAPRAFLGAARAHDPELEVVLDAAAFRGQSAVWLVGLRGAVDTHRAAVNALVAGALGPSSQGAGPARGLALAQTFGGHPPEVWGERLEGLHFARLVDNLDAFERWAGADGRAFALWRTEPSSPPVQWMQFDFGPLEAARDAGRPGVPTPSPFVPGEAGAWVTLGETAFPLPFTLGAVTPTSEGEQALSKLRDQLVLAPGVRVTVTAYGDGLEPSMPPGTADAAELPDPNAPTVGSLAEERAAFVVTWLQDRMPRAFPPGRLVAVGNDERGEGVRLKFEVAVDADR